MRLLRKLKFARNDNLRLRAQDFLPIYDVGMNIVAGGYVRSTKKSHSLVRTATRLGEEV